MATSYTSLLGFALPVTSELQGTWGDTVNNSITQLCEDSIAGVATASVTSADWTLTTTGSGAANQARMAILIPTGTPGVSRNIIAPSSSKTYTVINQSNAAVVLKGAATTGVTIAAGDKVVVVWNGSDFVSLVTTNAAGVFTTLSASSTVTLSGGTANGVAYLNGSKVLTTGSGLVFDGTNLGLGVTPSAWYSSSKTLQFTSGAIHTYGSSINFGNNAYLDSSQIYRYVSNGYALNHRQNNGQYQWHTAPSGTAGNAISFTQAMTLDADGHLLVGTTTVPTYDAMLRSQTNVNTAAALDLYVNVASALSVPCAYMTKYDNNNTTSNVFIKFTIAPGATTGSGQINANGASQAAFGTWSDSRLKENIVDLPSQLQNIMALRPVEFDYIKSEGGGHQIGFIAQEMQEVYPDAVGEREDGMLTVTGWSKTESRLIKAIQEQQAIIEQLTARITTLEAK
jgi:hypothetical protein